MPLSGMTSDIYLCGSFLTLNYYIRNYTRGRPQGVFSPAMDRFTLKLKGSIKALTSTSLLSLENFDFVKGFRNGIAPLNGCGFRA
jgi:hypothetical protein